MTALIKYDAACRALAEAKAVDEVKDLRDKAEAMRIYGMQAKNKTLEIDAAEIRIRAERRLGELIAAQKATVGLNTGSRGQLHGRKETGEVLALVDDEGQKPPSLSDAGISYDLSSRAQKIAAVPEAEFEAEVVEWRERVSAENARVTTRLEKAGERAAKKKGHEPAASSAELADLKSMLAEQAGQFEQTLAENIALQKIVDADDRLAEAMRQIKQLTAENMRLRERINGLTNEAAEAKRLAKSWRSRAERAERTAA
ncbi:hypothetical protein [Thiohalocapsa marina]|uniref:hypothetical protein n=1 Tax=Thiohalocapsa marina TaxID=424902 RepID=UPI0036DA218C